MFTSIDDVTPIDSTEVGNRIADFLQTAGQIALFTTIALFVVYLILAIVIAKKAGYSGWWGALAVLVPPLGVLLVLLFALLKWPALKQRDEALGILKANDLTLPSDERAAIKEAERKQQIEDEARRRMEKAQADRVKAEADREKFREAQARDAATRVASANAAEIAAASEAKPADAPVATPEANPADAPAGTTETPAKKPVAKKPAVSQPDAVAGAAPEAKPDAAPEAKPEAPKEN
jgi:cytoskeletal protein RodZ